jgi:replicative DNA helicase
MNQEIPKSIDAEEAVLGSILIDEGAINTIDLQPADFFSEQNQLIFDAIQKVGIGINQITVAQQLADMGKLDDVGGVAYLSYLVANTPTSLHAEYYANVVRKCAVNRRLISLAEQVKVVGYNNDEPDIAFDRVQSLVNYQLAQTHGDSLITPNQLFNLGFDLYAQRKEGKAKYYPTGLREYDDEMGGLFSSEVTVIASRPGHGKTELATQIAKHVGKIATEPVLYGSLEMHWREMLDRMVASELQVHPRSLRVGHYSDEFYEQITGSLPKVTDNNIYLFGKGIRDVNLDITTDALYRAAYQLKSQKGLSLLVVDHLGCFGDRYGNSDYSKMGYVAQRVKNIAVALDVATLCICQLSRAVETQKHHIPSNKDLRDSGRIEEIVDNIVFLYRPDKYPELIAETPALRGTARLILTKARQSGIDTGFDLIWNEYTRQYYSKGEIYV